MTYFDSVGIEHIPKEIKKFIGNKNVITNIFRIQVYDLIMCEYFRTGFIGFMFKGKTLIHFTNLFLPRNCKKKNEVILNYFLIKNINMNRPKGTFPQFHNLLQFRLRKSKSRRFFIAEINNRTKCAGNWIKISQHSIMLTRICLFFQVQAFLSLLGFNCFSFLIYHCHWYSSLG